MPSIAEAALLRRNPSKRLVVGVAIDGSDVSDRALAAAARFVSGARGDRLIVLHVSDASKTFLPRHLQPKHLGTAAVDKAAALRVCAEWSCREKGPGGSTCEALMALARDARVDLLVVGSCGRKGERVDMLGTVSDSSLRAGSSSVCIVRSRAPPRPLGARQHFLCATDGSRAAAVAFCMLMHQLVKPGDRITLATLGYEHQSGGARHGTGSGGAGACTGGPPGCGSGATSSAPEWLRDYEVVAGRLELPVETLVWKLERHQTVADGLLALVAQHSVDTLVLGISGYSRAKLGSVSDEITRRASCNTIVIKDTYEVGVNHVANSSV